MGGGRGLGVTSGEVFTIVGIGLAMIGLGVEEAKDSVELEVDEGDGTSMEKADWARVERL